MNSNNETKIVPVQQWHGANVNYDRSPARAAQLDRMRQAGRREMAVAQPAPETAATVSHAWGIPYPLAQRLLALEAKNEVLMAIIRDFQVRITALEK